MADVFLSGVDGFLDHQHRSSGNSAVIEVNQNGFSEIRAIALRLTVNACLSSGDDILLWHE